MPSHVRRVDPSPPSSGGPDPDVAGEPPPWRGPSHSSFRVAAARESFGDWKQRSRPVQKPLFDSAVGSWKRLSQVAPGVANRNRRHSRSDADAKCLVGTAVDAAVSRPASAAADDVAVKAARAKIRRPANQARLMKGTDRAAASHVPNAEVDDVFLAAASEVEEAEIAGTTGTDRADRRQRASRTRRADGPTRRACR